MGGAARWSKTTLWFVAKHGCLQFVATAFSLRCLRAWCILFGTGRQNISVCLNTSDCLRLTPIGRCLAVRGAFSSLLLFFTDGEER